MRELHGRPTAQELTEAVRELLEGKVLADGVPAGAFAVRVAVNALKIVERELATGGEDVRRHRQRLGALGFGDDAALAGALRRGEVPAERLPEVRAAVLASVEDKLRVANPKHLEGPDERAPDQSSRRASSISTGNGFSTKSDPVPDACPRST